MRAKTVNENQQFQRGQDPKESLGIGIRNYEDYLNMKIRQLYPNENPEKKLDEFWGEYHEGFEDWSTKDIADEVLSILENTPLEYQIEYFENELEMFQEEW
jgi:hypothetical protein